MKNFIFTAIFLTITSSCYVHLNESTLKSHAHFALQFINFGQLNIPNYILANRKTESSILHSNIIYLIILFTKERKIKFSMVPMLKPNSQFRSCGRY